MQTDAVTWKLRFSTCWRIALHSLACPAGRPRLLVPNADGSYRFCSDYRKLNSVTKPDSFPLPRMNDCVDQVSSATFVSKLDLLKGYRQVPLTYLGKVVGQGQVHPVSVKVQAVVQYLAPTTKKELMCFLGLIGYYWSFCRDFSTVVAPLTDLLRGKEKFVWSPACQRAFEQVKVYTDHNPLTFLNSLQCPNQRLVRWSLFLRSYCLDIRYVKRTDNIVADALSRALTD